jgi:protein-tyrosine phosphatase
MDQKCGQAGRDIVARIGHNTYITMIMGTKLYWVEGPWLGKLALAARPRGGDWLVEEIAEWRRAGVNSVFSLLETAEEAELELALESATVESLGMRFLSFPIPDRQVPASENRLTGALEDLDAELRVGRNVVVHCRQGIGRTGLVAACLLVTKGNDPRTAIQRLSAARGVPIPETDEQRRWIEKYATTLAPHE